jgi:AcrR family transcriptional regulator
MNKSPEQTRRILLENAYHEIHLHGFQGASISKILEKTGLTKGALYHHFKNKNEMGYAVVDEIIKEEIFEMWVTPMSNSVNPVDDLVQHIKCMCGELDEVFLQRGCPLNNLIQEMSPIDPIFRDKLSKLLDLWRNSLKEAFQRGQEAGNVTLKLKAEDIAHFLIAHFEGISSMTQSVQNASIIEHCMAPFAHFLQSLKP